MFGIASRSRTPITVAGLLMANVRKSKFLFPGLATCHRWIIMWRSRSALWHNKCPIWHALSLYVNRPSYLFPVTLLHSLLKVYRENGAVQPFLKYPSLTYLFCSFQARRTLAWRLRPSDTWASVTRTTRTRGTGSSASSSSASSPRVSSLICPGEAVYRVR